MASFNKVILAGNLTRDPQLTYLPSNTAVAEFGMAMNRRWKSQDGQDREEVCFVDLRCYGRQAETINKYMKKGRPLLVEGHLRFEQWEGKDGQKRSRLCVVVDSFQFIDSRRDGDGPPASGGGGSRSADRESAPPPQHEPDYAPAAGGGGTIEEVPF